MRSIYIAFVLIFLYTSCDYVYKTKYLDVPIDHFNFNDNRTFKLQFLINDSYWRKKNGPIFFYTGNEGNIEFFAQNTGFLWEAAKEFKALVVFAEHRYYGKSLPFGNLSYSAPEYFGYLSSQQALADFVDVIYYVKSLKWSRKYRCSANSFCAKSSPVIAFGGSYGGMLASWFRMKYPAVVQGALASSAPIWQFSGMSLCSTFFEVLSSIYDSVGSGDCVSVIKKSWGVLTDLTKTENGRDWINENWKLCKPIENDADLKVLKDWLQEVYVDIAMCNYPYPTSFLMPLPSYPVKVICSFLNDSSVPDKELLMLVFRGISIYFNGTGTAKCLNWEKESSTDISETAWDVQSCTELVMPLCTTGKRDMFEPNPWNFKKESDDCYNKFKVRPIENLAEKEYGGKRINTASNIIFSNGLLDPWSSGGVLYNVSSSVIAVIIPESAHHLDLRAENPNDPISVRNARTFYRSRFTKWIKQYHHKKRYRSM